METQSQPKQKSGQVLRGKTSHVGLHFAPMLPSLVVLKLQFLQCRILHAVILPCRFEVSTWTGTGQEVSFFPMLLLQLLKKIGEVELNVVVRFSNKLDLTAVQAGPEQTRKRLVRKSCVRFRVRHLVVMREELQMRNVRQTCKMSPFMAASSSTPTCFFSSPV